MGKVVIRKVAKMNERIKELVEVAFNNADYPTDQQYRIVPNAAFCEKFAELIIRECADKIKENWTRHCTGSVRPTDYNLGLSRAISSIEEHFGVEE
jgi:hypothetical protein